MKKNWKLIVGILFIICGFACLPNIGETACGVVIGAVLVYLWYLPKKKNADAKAEKISGYLKYKVVGVIYNNDDGTDRQRILGSIFSSGGITSATFKPYKYQGENALYVMTGSGCVGVITREKVAEVSEVIKTRPTAKLVVDFAKNNTFTADVVFE